MKLVESMREGYNGYVLPAEVVNEGLLAFTPTPEQLASARHTHHEAIHRI